MANLRSLVSVGGAVLVWALVASGCGGGESGPTIEELEAAVDQQTAAAAKLEVTSSAFAYDERIPPVYTCYGEDKSPDLKWAGAPPDTKSLAIIVDDPDAVRGAITRIQWVAYAIPPDVTEIPEAGSGVDLAPPGAKNGVNDFERLGYSSPCPQRTIMHEASSPRTYFPPERYFFKVYALDIELDLLAGATKADLLAAMDGHILAGGNLMGRYQAPPKRGRELESQQTPLSPRQ